MNIVRDAAFRIPQPREHCATGFELVLRVLRWAESSREVPSVEAIQTRWLVSRATAYRWRAALAAAMAENWKPRTAL